ncbi:DUF2911 domain-containing protein [Actomonas aquatica]|uniref:DUF2911 domain-containing protein n=1 Tax=Actomonas aquatica TaxID=2866162 RepID=A0ABZ1C381_9BACT|nr:DUF2911 domain-containing protein [Opitutus sp. WL0086]WRQ86050.1 DUF2911 domain-containing protein [Opitutus sp. WL0086]
MKPTSLLRLVAFSSACALALPSLSLAQGQLQFPAASPNAKVSQTVGLTEVEIVYARPAMRGREIFGGLLPYDSIWRTGANAATTISFSTPVVFGGAEVPAGTYALYSVPHKGDWEVILSSKDDTWGSYSFTPEDEVVRVTATPVMLDAPVESLTLSLDDVVNDSATLNIAWADVRVPVSIVADTQAVLVPQITAVLASDAEQKPYFQAAMYLYEKGVMLDQAAEWINEAAKQQPDAFWLTYRQGLVLEAAGDKAGALAAAQRGLKQAQAQQPGELRDEYIHLNETLIARLEAAM